jgi:hypothetical protein
MQKKGLALCTDDQHLKPFDVRVNDLVRSPVGMVGCVLGVKYASATDAEAMQGGRRAISMCACNRCMQV